jgi:hypothetical protein
MMNERIRQLAEQAGMIIGDNSEFDMEKFMPKELKFAQLIVKECADICYNRDYACGSAYGEQIEKHFGVEE